MAKRRYHYQLGTNCNGFFINERAFLITKQHKSSELYESSTTEMKKNHDRKK